MKGVIIGYDKISPAVLANIIERAITGALCDWRDFDDDSFELIVMYVDDMAELEHILARYV